MDVQKGMHLAKIDSKKIKLTLKPWITSEIQKLVRIRDRLHERKKKDSLIMTMSEKYITG